MRMEIRGNPNQPGDVVAPGGHQPLAAPGADFGLKPDAPEARRRERLAAWVCSSRNPLFARVVVNRLWQAHFGTGFVENCQRLRLQWRPAVSSGAARLAGLAKSSSKASA